MLKPSARLIPLEAYRGLAALIVLVHHFFLAFAPRVTGRLAELRDEDSLVGTPWFMLFNGTAAVAFFFTLSGFVLSWSYFRRNDLETLRRSFLRRWPRLTGIVVVSTFLSAALYLAGMYYFHEAAQVSGSPWLARQFEPVGNHPNLLRATLQGATTFFTGYAGYNSNLWTMRPEFYGSMFVYMLAAFVVLVLKGRHLLPAMLLMCASAAFVYLPMTSFICGTFLAYAIAHRKPVISPIACGAILLVSLYLLGYLVPIRYYAWAGMAPAQFANQVEQALHTAGSVGVIFATMTNRRLFNNLDNRYFAMLGKLSFPLYLTHTLVIASVSSFCYLWLQTFHLTSVTVLGITFACTLLGTFALSWPLEKFDAWWVTVISRRIAAKEELPEPAHQSNQVQFPLRAGRRD